jgi:hypothetical protein
MRLTEVSDRALKGSDTYVTHFDHTLPGVGIRIGKRSRTFITLISEYSFKGSLLPPHGAKSIDWLRNSAFRSPWSSAGGLTRRRNTPAALESKKRGSSP